MHIGALQTFLAVVETGNLNKAAEQLNLSQSAVTARLDALEDRLGQPLLVRSRKGAQLTRAGFRLRPFAESLVRGWEQAQSFVGLPKGYAGLFSFACEFDLWASAGKRWLDERRVAHPDCAFEAWARRKRRDQDMAGKRIDRRRADAGARFGGWSCIKAACTRTAYPGFLRSAQSQGMGSRLHLCRSRIGIPQTARRNMDQRPDRRRYVCRKQLGARPSPGTGRLRLPALGCCRASSGQGNIAPR